ncbi:MAG TPA: very short patch repair endonuclease [Blastocatellia bacterium]|jgi:DNA mismatch endonuclease (patch repair protein)|nr:very short patch repair endonuclease [Blastocatellia bacterium]
MQATGRLKRTRRSAVGGREVVTAPNTRTAAGGRVGARKKPGHRSWGHAGEPVPGGHRGDIMPPETRSALMSRIKGANTGPERTLFRALRRHGIHFNKHVRSLPGRPDIVCQRAKLAVFVDGDFWHGWRFPLWEHKLLPKWRQKIQATRCRDKRNFRALRRLGWKVLRIWEHQIESNSEKCIDRILVARSECLAGRAKILPRSGEL